MDAGQWSPPAVSTSTTAARAAAPAMPGVRHVCQAISATVFPGGVKSALVTLEFVTAPGVGGPNQVINLAGIDFLD